MAAKLGSFKSCKHCRGLMRLSNVQGSVVWCHARGAGARCREGQARKAERLEREAARRDRRTD